jgi:pentatricopeptide repeat protein
LDYATVNKLSYRELQKECRERGLPAVGNTAALRSRLLNQGEGDDTADLNVPEALCAPDGISFSDESDPNFEFNSLLKEVMNKAQIGHWKAATRKLKKLKNCFATPERPVPAEAYVAVLEACVEDRLHGARASIPARKILEEMSEQGYVIPSDLGNSCVVNSLGEGPNATHDGCGGIDIALAMLSAMESSSDGVSSMTSETYGAVVSALSRDGAVEEAVLLLRAMVVEHSYTPSLSTFADVAEAASKAGGKEEIVLQVMTLAKAAGYVLDNIASAGAGRSILASGVIAAEQMDNLALGLRLLTAASKAEGCDPDKGDALVASSSSAAQRACTLIHKRAIDTAVKENNWKLAVKLLALMTQRSLTPGTGVWRQVVSVCCRNEKSKKATALLLDWVKLAEEGKANRPPLNAFNTVVNTCEICGEEELTVAVLDEMKKTHKTDGNIVTFNIALKRLAKQGNIAACEGIIIGMLQAGIEPNVVTYTTAIGACVKAGDSAYAYEWLKRMRSRGVKPNFHTYNTALAACLDGTLDSTVRGSKIGTEMLLDIVAEMEEGFKGDADYKSVIPDQYTKVLARNLMKQLRENWRAGDINISVAKATVRVPLLNIVDFDRSEMAKKVKQQKEERKQLAQQQIDVDEDEECDIDVEECEEEAEYSAVNLLSKETARRMEV